MSKLRIPARNSSCGKKRHYSPDDAERHRLSLEASDHAAGRLKPGRGARGGQPCSG
jgi:hypothetical protein